MGQFQDYLNKMMIVESQGFNPMTESYSTRVGKLPTTDPTLTASQITEAFTSQGYDDPIATLIDEEGKLNAQTFNTAYNNALNIPKIGIDSRAFVDFVNTNYPREMSTTYFPEAQFEVTKDDTIRFPQKEKPKEDLNYRFERAPSQSQKKGASDVFIRWDDNDKTGRSYITYESEQAYNEAIEKYKSITGKDVETGEKEDL